MARSACKIAFAAIVVTGISCSLTLGSPAIVPTTEASPGEADTPDLYAGFTQSKEVPFLILHRSGEHIGVTEDPDSSQVTGVVWTSAGDESIVVYSDSNGRPTRSVIGDEVVTYSNYTETSVDIEILHADGSLEAFPALIDVEMLNRITAAFPLTLHAAALALPAPGRSQQQDLLAVGKTALYLLSAATCIVAVPGSLAIPPVGVPLLAVACGGFIMSTLVRVGTALNLDVSQLESALIGWNIGKCALLDPIACTNLIVAEMERRKKLADETLVKAAWPAPVPAPVQPPSAPLGPATLYLDRNYYCRVSPCRESRDVTGFESGTRLPILATTNTGWWQVKIDLSWSNEKACWIGGGIPEGDYTSVEIVQPTNENCGGGGTPEGSSTPSY